MYHSERCAPVLVGDSEPMRRVRAMLSRVAPSSAPVLLAGPSGTGKEVAARMLHMASPRASGTFVGVNCGALPTDLFEAEMFGAEAGAYTGAARARPGRIEMADRGTLMLDEVGETPLGLQVKLLRVLETGMVERVGGGAPRPVSARLVAATNADLPAAIAAGRFRADLFYRLAVVMITMPALRDCAEDVPALLAHHAARFGDGERPYFDAAAVAWLRAYPWPGNVRELRNLVDRAAAVGMLRVGRADAEQLLVGFAAPAREPEIRLPVAPVPPVALAGPAEVDLQRVVAEMEAALIVRALDASGGEIAAAARLLKLKRTTLAEKMRRCGIERPERYSAASSSASLAGNVVPISAALAA